MKPWVLMALGIAVAFLFVLGMRKSRNSPLKESQGLEEALTRFFQEIEEANDQLLKKIEKIHAQWKGELEQVKAQIGRLEKEVLAIQQRREEDPETVVPSSSCPAPAFSGLDIDPLQLKERYPSIIALMQEGHSLDEIAKKTGRGKGELQLIRELWERQSAAKP